MRRETTLRYILIGGALATSAFAQTFQRQASMVGGGNTDRGKCTIEVVVDDVAEIEIRGTTATIRTISGQPAQFRRFECSGPLPAQAANFRFQGVDGRGRQTLIRDPQNGGVAVVRIEDRDGGSEGYTFDIFWDPRGSNYSGNGQGRNGADYRNQPNGQVFRQNDGYQDRADDQYRPNYRDSDYYHRYNHGFQSDEAVRVCQREIDRQATRRFGNSDIHFYRTTLDSNPGRQDWIMGSLDVHRGPRIETYNFSCSVDFESGKVRSGQMDERPSRVDTR